MQKPLLPDCFLTWTEPPDQTGAEQLRFVSWRRSLTMKGRSFREFERVVFPLLDGTRSMDEICDSASSAFPRDELEAAIEMLAGQGLLIDGAAAADDPPARLATQLGYLDETAPDGRGAQARLARASVAVFGSGRGWRGCRAPARHGRRRAYPLYRPRGGRCHVALFFRPVLR